jgi:Glycosyltransferase family 87
VPEPHAASAGPATAPPRPPRSTVVAAGVALLGLAWLLVAFVALPDAPAWGYDFEAYRNAAVRLVETGSLYQAETLAGPFDPGPFGLYLYPPPLGVAVGPFTAISLDLGATLWFGLHVAALLVACALLPVPLTTRLLAFGVAALSFGVLRDVILGNVSVLLLPFLALAWRFLDRPAGSVATALAISMRPTLGLLLVWQLLRRRWSAVAWALATGLVLIALTLPFVGPGGYTDYLTVLRNLSGITGVERNIDLGSTVLALGGGHAAAQVALLAGYALAIVAMLASLRRDAEVGFMVTLGASLLLSPLLWDHYLATLVLPAAFLAARGRPVGILLPLLTWLPAPALPFVVVAAAVAPFWARDRVTDPGPRRRIPSPAPLPA